MTADGLSPLQRRVLGLLAGMEPRWSLTGGAALIGLHGVPRTTRDLDLVFRGRETLERTPDLVHGLLMNAGLEVTSLQAGAAHHSLRVSDATDVLVVDLIAEPVPAIEAPEAHDWEEGTILADSAHELLVNKLCALLHRSELRDLSDLGELLDQGGDLGRALRDAPRKEAGFSPLTLAWLLREMPIATLASTAGHDAQQVQRLEQLRGDLVERLGRDVPEAG